MQASRGRPADGQDGGETEGGDGSAVTGFQMEAELKVELDLDAMAEMTQKADGGSQGGHDALFGEEDAAVDGDLRIEVDDEAIEGEDLAVAPGKAAASEKECRRGAEIGNKTVGVSEILGGGTERALQLQGPELKAPAFREVVASVESEAPGVVKIIADKRGGRSVEVKSPFFRGETLLDGGAKLDGVLLGSS